MRGEGVVRGRMLGLVMTFDDVVGEDLSLNPKEVTVDETDSPPYV